MKEEAPRSTNVSKAYDRYVQAEKTFREAKKARRPSEEVEDLRQKRDVAFAAYERLGDSTAH